MKNKFTNFMIKFIGMLSMILYVGALLAPEAFSSVISDGALTIAVGTAGGAIDTGSTDRDRVKPDVSSKISIVRPDMFRLDTALRKIKSSPAKDVEIKWEEVGQRPRVAQIDGSADIAAGSTTDIPFTTTGEYSYFIPNDVARVVDPATNTDHANFDGVRLLVTAVNSVDNEITVVAFDSTGFITVPAIPINTFGSRLDVVRIAHAKTEKEGVGQATSMKPVTKSNNVHTFEKHVEISKMRKKLSTYTKDDMVRNIEQNIFDLRLDMEGAFWDGVGINTTRNGDKMYTMKGFSHYVTSNVISLPSVGSLTEAFLIDVGEQLASDVHGSEEKMLFVSPKLWSELSKLNLVSGTLQNRRSETVLGSQATRINTGHCEFLIANHKGFPQLGKTRYGAIVDMANIKKRVLEPMQTTDIDPEKSGGARTSGKKYLETCSLEIRNEATHGILI